MLPLAGIKVLDLTSVAMGPFASQWLGDFGADIIKIEAPQGDTTRHTGPTSEAGMSAIFMGTNRNKRSIVLDLKRPEARDAFLRLVDDADIFMHSVRPQKLKKLGLDPDTIRARKPQIVYAGFHGFAENGPYGGRPAYDDIIQGLSGGAALMQKQSGEARYFPTIMADKTSGLIGAISILAALQGRNVTGVGSYVEIPMFESMVAFNLQEHLYGAHFDPPLAGTTYPRVMSPSRRPFKTADSYICMMPYTDAHWRYFFAELGAPEIAEEERFTGITNRTSNIDALYALAAEYIRQKSTDQWIEICNRLQIPAAPMLQIDDLPNDEHLKQTGFFHSIEDEKMGKVRFTGVPILLNGERPPIAFPPRLGEHSREILTEAGLSDTEIDAALTNPEKPVKPDKPPI